MVPELPGGREPSQYGPWISWGSETKSIWFLNYLRVGNQVNMVPEFPGGRKPSQYGSWITWESETKSIWFRHTLADRIGPFSSKLIVVTVGWGPTVISGKGHQNQRGSKERGRQWRFQLRGINQIESDWDRVVANAGSGNQKGSKTQWNMRIIRRIQHASVPRVRNAETRNRRWITLTIRWNASQNA